MKSRPLTVAQSHLLRKLLAGKRLRRYGDRGVYSLVPGEDELINHATVRTLNREHCLTWNGERDATCSERGAALLAEFDAWMKGRRRTPTLLVRRWNGA